MPKENQRVRITKMLLNESFLNLLKKRPLSRVTVKDICEGADLNRSTYYKYYSDPYDQMNKLEIEIFEEISACVDFPNDKTPQGYEKLYPVIERLLDYMQEKKNIFRILLSNNGDISLQKDILTVLAEKLLPQGFNTSDRYTESLQEFIFVSNGSFGLIYYWLMSDNSESTKQLAERIADFVENFLKGRKRYP